MSTASERDRSTGLVQLLSSSRQGRLLTNHLACVSVKLANSTFDSSMRQCVSMRRVVLDALRNQERNNPFRLPAKLPKSIVVANLAGENVMFYEHGYSLIYRFLNIVTTPMLRQSVRGGIDAMTKFADDTGNRSLLLVYSMPPLEDPSGMHWELRSVTVDSGKVLDGARHFARNALEPCYGTPTGESTEPALLKAETIALQNHVMAVPVDVEDDATSDSVSNLDGSTRETVLRNTISALQADRKQLVNEINSMRYYLFIQTCTTGDRFSLKQTL